MPITLITGPANAGKARVLLDSLRAEAATSRAEARAGPLLVVPTAADAELYRRELAERGPTLGVGVTLFAGLVERIVSSAVAAEPLLRHPPISELARRRMLSTLAAREQAGVGLAGDAWGRALSRVVAALQLAGVAASRLAAAGADASLLTLYRAYERRLAAIGRLDVESRQRLALDALRRTPSLWEGAAVFLYGFDDLTPSQLDAIETLGRIVDADVTVSLPYEAGRAAFAGRAWAFAELSPIAAKHVPLRARAAYYASDARQALYGLERGLFGRDSQTPSLDPRVAVRLLEGGSERAELQLVAAEAAALIGQGIQAEEIAIVHRAPETIAEQLSDILDEAGVPHPLSSGARFADTSIGRGLLGLLSCACGRSDGSEASLADLLAWLRCPRVLERIELADRLEQRALRSGVSTAAAARGIWEQEHWPLERIDRVAEAAARGVLPLIERAERELLRLFGGRWAREAAVLGQDQDEQVRALRAGIGALRELRELARCEQSLIGGSSGVIDSLQALSLQGADAAAHGAVALLSPLALRARRVNALFLCGLQEGTFPAGGQGEPLLSDDRLRELLGRAGGRGSHPDEVLAAERYLLYATLSRPRERLFLSWHECRDDGEASPRSLFVDDVCDLFDQSLWQQRRRHGAGAVEPPVSGSVADALFEPASAPFADFEPEGARLRLRDERVLARLRERTTWSASSLERWAACPVSWFVERMLIPAELEPEAEPLLRGGLAHAVLSDVYEGLRQATGSARISTRKLALARQLLATSLRAREAEYPLSVAPERLAAGRRRLRADLERYLQATAAATAEAEADHRTALEPTHFELSFGFEDEPDGLPALPLGGDRLRLRGRIDRIDVGQQREAVVYDYKSGRVSGERSASKWLERSVFQIALYISAARQLLHLDPIGGLYQPLSGELTPRGAIRLDARARLPCVRTDGVDAEGLDQLIGEVTEAAAAAAQEARSGALEARPRTCSYRGVCMYPAICRGGR